MNNVEDLEQLAELCLSTARQVKSYLASKDLPQPTFNRDGPAFSPQLSDEAELARLQLRDASQRLYDLASGPEEPLGQGIQDRVDDIAAIRYVFHFDVASQVPVDSSISYESLAQKTGTDVQQLRTMIRQLIQTRVFCEPVPEFVEHTAASKHFLSPDVSSWAGFHVLDRLPWVERQLEAIDKWGHGSPEPNETGANLVYKSDVPCYVSFAKYPDTMRRFTNLMEHLAKFPGWSITHAVNGFDWAGLGTSTVVDIGGSMGHCSVAFATKNPRAKFIVQDLPAVVARATDPATSIVPDEIKPHITFQDHNFNQPQPVIGADVYFIRMIMHNYSDKYCAKILRAIVPAMRANSRILIMDMVLPAIGGLPATIERTMRTMDMTMMNMLNAHERDESDWKRMFTFADPRLKIKSIVQPKGSVHSILEVILEGAPAS